MYREGTEKPHTNIHTKTKPFQKPSHGDESTVEYYVPED